MKAEGGSGRIESKVYDSGINTDAIDLITAPQSAVLDVGCGTGSNSRELKRRLPEIRLDAVTSSPAEAEQVADLFDNVWCGDLDSEDLPDSFRGYSSILCLHVLEHLREPACLVESLASRLLPGGSLVIAVPNVAHYGQRLALLRGSWKYTEFGILDWTHLRFFTFRTAREILVPPEAGLSVDSHRVSPSLPLGRLRTMRAAAPIYALLERACVAAAPNLFGWQVVIRARKA